MKLKGNNIENNPKSRMTVFSIKAMSADEEHIRSRELPYFRDTELIALPCKPFFHELRLTAMRIRPDSLSVLL